MSTLFIRTDSTVSIGTGHIMRCIALGQAWQDRGGQVIFLSRCESETLRERIIQEGFQFIAIENSHPDPSDLGHMLGIVKQHKTQNPKPKTWVVLDGYHFTPEYQKAIRDEGCHLLVIDDMNHLPHYHADILLNQNIHAPDIKYYCDEDTTLLLGTQYVLLRRQFLKYRDFKRQIPERAKNIFVTLGGADPDNVTLKVIEAIKLLNNPNIEVRVVVGPSNLHVAEIKNAMVFAPCPMNCIENAGNMPDLMVWADVAISAGGSTCWEIVFMGLPVILLVLAGNQQDIAKRLTEAGVALNLGWFEQVSGLHIVEALSGLLNNRSQRQQMSNSGRTLVDGTGSEKVISGLQEQ